MRAVAKMLDEQPLEEVIEQVVTLTCERDNYRVIAHQAIHQLHQAVRQRDRLLKLRVRDMAKLRKSKVSR